MGTLSPEKTWLTPSRIPGTGSAAYSFAFTYEKDTDIRVEIGESLDCQLWVPLTLGVHYTISRDIVGGTILLLSQSQGDALLDPLIFNWVSIRRIYPYQFETVIPNVYSAPTIDLAFNRATYDIQQLADSLEFLYNVPGITNARGWIHGPNDRGRIVKIDSDDGSYVFKGCSLFESDTGNGLHIQNDTRCDYDLYVKGDTDLTGDLLVNGQFNAGTGIFTSNLFVAGILSPAVIDNCAMATFTNVNAYNISNSNTIITKYMQVTDSFTCNGDSYFDKVDIRDLYATTLNPIASGELLINCTQLNVANDINAVGSIWCYALTVTEDIVCNNLHAVEQVTADMSRIATLMRVDNFLQLGDVQYHPQLNGSEVDDIWVTAPKVLTEDFQLVPRKIWEMLMPDVLPDWIPKISADGSQLVNSDLYDEDGGTAVKVMTKNLELMEGLLKWKGILDINGIKVLWDMTGAKEDYILHIQPVDPDDPLAPDVDWVVLPKREGDSALGDINVRADWFATGDGAAKKGLKESCLYEGHSMVIFTKPKDLVLIEHSLIESAGIFKFDNTIIRFVFPKTGTITGTPLVVIPAPGGVSWDWTILPWTPGTPGGGGGGGISSTVMPNYIPKGAADGSLINSHITELGGETLVDQNLRVLAGSKLRIDEGIMEVGGANIHWDIHPSGAAKQILAITATVANDITVSNVPIASWGGGGSGGAAVPDPGPYPAGWHLEIAETSPGVKEWVAAAVPPGGGSAPPLTVALNTFAMGDGAGGLIDSPLTHTLSGLNSTMSIFAPRLQTNTLGLGPVGTNNVLYSSFHQETAVNLHWRLDNMSNGETQPLYVKRNNSNVCELVTLVPAPLYPTVDPGNLFNEGIARWGAFDTIYDEKIIYGTANAVVYGMSLQGWNMRLLKIIIASFGTTTATPVAGQLSLNPNVISVLFATYTANIDRINFTEAMLEGTDILIYFYTKSDGLTVTFPDEWLWPGGDNYFYSIADEFKAVHLSMVDGQIFANFSRSGAAEPGDVGVRPIPPFLDAGTACFAGLYGTGIAGRPALTYGNTLKNWYFSTLKVAGVYSAPLQDVTASAGILTLTFDGTCSNFNYTHNANLAAIKLSISTKTAAAPFVFNLRIVTGTSAQRTLPVPDGCYYAYSNIVIKEGVAFLSGCWDGANMFINPVAAYDFKNIS